MGTDFIRAPSKASLLAMLKSAREINPRLLRSLFDGVIFKSEMINYLVSGGADHGELSGLTGDDHLQYLLTADATSRAFFAASWIDLTDTGETTLHTHANIGDGPWLPLAGGDVTGATTFDAGISVDTIAEQNADTGVTVDSLLIQDGNIAAVDYSFVTANDGATDVTAPELEELSDGSDTELHGHLHSHDTSSSPPVCFSSYIDVKARNAEYSLHGGLDSLDTAHDLGAGDLVVTCGTGKIMLSINAANDFAGDITVTGTTVDRNTGDETGADTDTITIDALTTDNSSADASGNVVHAFVGAYITAKWFKGSITISSADTDVTDMDTYQASFEQINDSPNIVLKTFDITANATNNAAWLYAYLYTLHVTGDKCNVDTESSIDLPAAEVTSGMRYRLRRGEINESFSGVTDGFWVDMFPGPLASTYWENINVKVWVEVGTAGSTTGDPKPPSGDPLLPVYHHWAAETTGQVPSHTQANPNSGGGGYNTPFLVVSESTGSYTKTIQGGGATNDIVIVDLGAPLDPNVSGIRVMILALMVTGAQDSMEVNLAGNPLGTADDDRLYWLITETPSPDEYQHYRNIGGVLDFFDTYNTGSNIQTGANWHYYQYEQTVNGNSTWSVYDTAGDLVYTKTDAYPGTAGAFPPNMQYLAVRATPATSRRVAQVWVGNSTDAWPSMPMTPITNL